MEDSWLIRALLAFVIAGLFACGYVFSSAVLKSATYRPPRWFQPWRLHEGGRLPEHWLRAAGVTRTGPSFREREALLLGCGLGGGEAAAIYELARRALILALPTLTLATWQFRTEIAAALPGFPPLGVPLALAAAFCAVMLDKPLLEAFRRYRAQRIIREIYAVSNQLLYYAGASLHIHAKLMRSLPHTSVIRGDLQRLLGEWYHDAGEAVSRFKKRLGTAEGASFAETIESLRLHEDEAYYALLKERIEDYKTKLELARESRKESASYVLFALAGIPILYTFQIFIYPWVQEGQKLFQSLNP